MDVVMMDIFVAIVLVKVTTLTLTMLLPLKDYFAGTARNLVMLSKNVTNSNQRRIVIKGTHAIQNFKLTLLDLLNPMYSSLLLKKLDLTLMTIYPASLIIIVITSLTQTRTMILNMYGILIITSTILIPLLL